MLPPRPLRRNSAVPGVDTGPGVVVSSSTGISDDAGIETGTADVDAADSAGTGAAITVGSFNPPSVLPTTKGCK
ncbi:hypothetical protein BYT27DRAFT_7184160 [Phlegmacium glaucopus]|nr:hypothetical protein BYT27DRAFT_7184160 [Phlegmacium glaucopus]